METESDFELICGTNLDLESAAERGEFRSDLLARINLWDFTLPGLADRREDIEPNLEYELSRFSAKSGKHITFNKEAREAFLKFALDPEHLWKGNFRDLNASITRMATLSSGGRIDMACVDQEIRRSRQKSALRPENVLLARILGADYKEKYDLFELAQLEKVIEVCRNSRSRAEAGKKLFAVSRQEKSSSNDSDRLGKYLARFGIEFSSLKE